MTQYDTTLIQIDTELIQNDIIKGFFDPNTEENLSYLELLRRCVTDPGSELSFLCLTPDGVSLQRFRRDHR